tara:strand:+ start:47807 stop:48055 length:249 start_codon:yes stop_codon:yes gene_type:complete
LNIACPARQQVYSAAELRTMQDVITLSIFAIYATLYLSETLTINHGAGFVLIGLWAQSLCTRGSSSVIAACVRPQQPLNIAP